MQISESDWPSSWFTSGLNQVPTLMFEKIGTHQKIFFRKICDVSLLDFAKIFTPIQIKSGLLKLIKGIDRNGSGFTGSCISDFPSNRIPKQMLNYLQEQKFGS